MVVKRIGAGDVLEFSLLALPCGAEIARKVRKFVKSRIAVCREHLAVRVDVDSFALRLLQQLMQVLEVVSRYNR